MNGEPRGFFTRPAAPLLNAGLGLLMFAAAYWFGGAVDGFPAPGYVAAGLLALVMVPPSVRRLRLGAESLRVSGWRTRVEMDYAEVERVEVLRRRATPLARAPVSYAALRAVDGRVAWIAAYDFCFPRKALLELGRRVQQARNGRAELVVGGQEGPQPRRSPLLVLLGAAVLAAGVLLLGMTAGEGLRRAQARSAGTPAEAQILSIQGPAESGGWTLELAGPGGARRSLAVDGGWVRGRNPGDRVAILAHPADPAYFILAEKEAEGWSAIVPGLIALALLFGGGRLLARALAAPVGVLEDLREAFRGPGTRTPS